MKGKRDYHNVVLSVTVLGSIPFYATGISVRLLSFCSKPCAAAAAAAAACCCLSILLCMFHVRCPAVAYRKGKYLLDQDVHCTREAHGRISRHFNGTDCSGSEELGATYPASLIWRPGWACVPGDH